MANSTGRTPQNIVRRPQQPRRAGQPTPQPVQNMTQGSNVLGRAMRYVTNAFAYAAEPMRQARREYRTYGRSHPMANAVLVDQQMATQVGGNELVMRFAKLAITNPHFYSALRKIINRVASDSDFIVEERRGGEWLEIKGHQFLDVMAKPNAFFSEAQMLGELAMSLNIIGQGFWFLVTDKIGQGRVREILPLQADKVKPEPLTLRISPITGKQVVDYRYMVGTQRMLPGENIVHFRMDNIFNYWEGLSPLTAAARTLVMDDAQTKWMAEHYGESHGVPSAIVSVPSELTEQEFLSARDEIASSFKERGAIITRAGDIDVQTLQFSIHDMETLPAFEYNEKVIESVLGVPAGLDDASSGQSRLAAEAALARDVIQPLLDMIAAALTLRISDLYQAEHEIRLRAENIIPQDAAIETSKYTTYSPDRTLQENRAELKLEPLVLGEELAEFQNLMDTVPQRYVELFFNAKQAEKQQALMQQQMMMGGMGMGAPGGAPPQAGGMKPTPPNLMSAQMNGNRQDPSKQDPALKKPAIPGMPKVGATVNAPKQRGSQPQVLGDRTVGQSVNKLRSLSMKSYFVRNDVQTGKPVAIYALDEFEQWERWRPEQKAWVTVSEPQGAGVLGAVSSDYVRRVTGVDAL